MFGSNHTLVDTLKNWLFRLQFPQSKLLAPQNPVLIYHATMPIENNLLISGNIHNIVPDTLYQQFEILKKHKKIVFIDELCSRIATGKDTSELACITFDDGYRSVIDYGLPILEALEVPATLFVITSIMESAILWRDKIRYLINSQLVDDFLKFAVSIDSHFNIIKANRFYAATKQPDSISSSVINSTVDKYMLERNLSLKNLKNGVYSDWTQLEAIQSEYLALGNHSHNHYVLSTMSPDEQHLDIYTAHQHLSQRNLLQSNVFSIPFGGKETYNEETLNIIESLGYKSICLSSSYEVVDAKHIDDHRIGATHLTAVNRFMPSNN